MFQKCHASLLAGGFTTRESQARLLGHASEVVAQGNRFLRSSKHMKRSKNKALIYWTICLSVCLSVDPSIHPSIDLSIYPSIHPSIYLSMCVYVYVYVYVYKYMHVYLQNYANAYVSVIVSSQSSAIAGVSIHQICGLRQKVHLIISAADALAADPIHHSSERPQRVRDLEPGTARELQDVAANANLRTLRNLSCPWLNAPGCCVSDISYDFTYIQNLFRCQPLKIPVVQRKHNASEGPK